MERIQGDPGDEGARVVLSTLEFAVLYNALNEVSNGTAIEEWEFQTRLGVELWEARQLMDEIGAARDSLAGDV